VRLAAKPTERQAPSGAQAGPAGTNNNDWEEMYG